ncbi:MAG: molecular chaperone TorD family protein [Halomonas sp.]|nr:molecular chaperone TorD family protein [Halomonas sp.]
MKETTLLDLLPNAEFAICMARATQGHHASITLADMQDALIEDLCQLSDVLPMLERERVDTLALALTALTDTQQLLLGYSKLFLSPPAPAPLNLGAYLDGSLMARSVQAMETLYRQHGLERDRHFRELPDHLSLNLQWLAWIYSEIAEARQNNNHSIAAINDAVTMLRDFSLPALEGIRRKIVAASGDTITQPWRLLIELIQAQLTSDLDILAPFADKPVAEEVLGSDLLMTQMQTFETSDAPKEQLICRSCDSSFQSSPVLSEMRKRLQEAGVSADHLSLCPRCQNSDNNAAMRPPGSNIKAWQ